MTRHSIGTITYDDSDGAVTFNGFFNGLPRVIRMDILQDLRFDIEQEYSRLHEEAEAEFKRKRGGS